MAHLGLGGTSLVNGNIFLESDESTLAAPGWPSEITSNPECLDECELEHFSPPLWVKNGATSRRDPTINIHR